MFKFFKTLLFVMLCNVVVAQTHHFIYIENTKQEWFTVKVNNIIYESIGKNFITIPKLDKGIYTLIITTQSSKETKFSIAINNEDKGFSIKQNEDKIVELFDINNFKTITANVIDKPINKIESLQIEENKIAKIATKITKGNVKKMYSKLNKEGVDEIYVDSGDTVSIYISTEKNEAKDDITKVSTTLNINTEIEKNANENCKAIADENDVKNFTLAAQAELKVKDKLKIANNFLKEKCYSVNQIKRLCNLFINSNGKFIFFKQAQQSISDKQNFQMLQTELTDAAVIEEFKAFVKQL